MRTRLTQQMFVDQLQFLLTVLHLTFCQSCPISRGGGQEEILEMQTKLLCPTEGTFESSLCSLYRCPPCTSCNRLLVRHWEGPRYGIMGPSNLFAVCLFPSHNLAPNTPFPPVNHQDPLKCGYRIQEICFMKSPQTTWPSNTLPFMYGQVRCQFHNLSVNRLLSFHSKPF